MAPAVLGDRPLQQYLVGVARRQPFIASGGQRPVFLAARRQPHQQAGLIGPVGGAREARGAAVKSGCFCLSALKVLILCLTVPQGLASTVVSLPMAATVDSRCVTLLVPRCGPSLCEIKVVLTMHSLK